MRHFLTHMNSCSVIICRNHRFLYSARANQLKCGIDLFKARRSLQLFFLFQWCSTLREASIHAGLAKNCTGAIFVLRRLASVQISAPNLFIDAVTAPSEQLVDRVSYR